MLFWLVVLALLLHCAGSGCNGSPSAVRVVDSHFVEVRHLGSGIRSLNWDDLHNHLDVGSISSWANGIERSDSVELASLFASVCFTETEPVEEGGMHVMSVIRPLTLLEINQLLDDSDDGKTVPSACLDGMKSVRAAALAAGASSRGKSARRGGHGLPYGANGGMTNLDDKALEVAQREYAYLLGGSKESVPLEQTIVIRRSPDSPKPSMLGEIVVTRKNADVYENFQLGYWNNRVESEAWSDKFKSAFDNVKTTGLPRSVEGEDLVYVDQPGYFDNVFAHLDEMFSATVSGNVGRSRSAHRKTDAAPEPISNSSLKIDIQGNAYEWQPTKTDRFLNPKETSDWEDGFSKKFDPSLEMYRLFALAPWKSDETGTELILDIEGACKSSKDDNSDLKAVALIINRLDKPNIDTSEAQNVYAIYDDLFFTVGDEVNPTASRICKNRVIRQTAVVSSLYAKSNFFIDDFVESRTKSRSRESRSRSGSGEGRKKSASGSQRRRSTGSKEGGKQKLRDYALRAIGRVLRAMSREGETEEFRKLCRSGSCGSQMIDWLAVEAFLRSRRGGIGLRAESGVIVIDAVALKGIETDLWHLRDGFGDPRTDATKELLKTGFKAKKHHFILQVRGIYDKSAMKQMVIEFIKSKEACNKDKNPVLVKTDGPLPKTSYLFQSASVECLDAIFELHPSNSSDKETGGLDKLLFIRLRRDLAGVPDRNLDATDPIFFDIRLVLASETGCLNNPSYGVRSVRV